MNDELDASPEERAEAEALAQALDGQGEAELSRDRAQAVLQRVMAEAGPELDKRQRSFPWQRWMLPLGGLGLATATAAALLLWGPVAPVSLPVPDAALLKAQAAAATPKADAAVLRRGMQAYRGRMLAALDERYGGGS